MLDAGKHHLSSAFFQERRLGRPGVTRGRGRGAATGAGAPGGAQEVTYTVPADKCGLVIGKVAVLHCSA